VLSSRLNRMRPLKKIAADQNAYSAGNAVPDHMAGDVLGPAQPEGLGPFHPDDHDLDIIKVREVGAPHRVWV
jgi:hypothetical protein